ncbi:MAG: TM1266 family iron-only hydrogenase system putative regulator [Bacillota bacterium]|jgi:putative iron-only hydrogenase system regulator
MACEKQDGRSGQPEAKRVGVAAIIIQDRLNAAPAVNKILSEYGEIIVGRMGIPYTDRHVSVIALIVDGDTDAIGAMTGKLGSIPGVKSRVTLVPSDNESGE